MTEELKQKAEVYSYKLYHSKAWNPGEDMLVKAYLAGATENGIQWHDLRKDSNDLPKEYDSVLARTECYEHKTTSICNYHYKKWWVTSEFSYSDEEVIAWCEIPQFKE